MADVEARLRKVLALEEKADPNWSEIEVICDEIVRVINEEDCTQYLGTIAYKFAEDYDVRQKSDEYASMQREQLRRWLK